MRRLAPLLFALTLACGDTPLAPPPSAPESHLGVATSARQMEVTTTAPATRTWARYQLGTENLEAATVAPDGGIWVVGVGSEAHVWNGTSWEARPISFPIAARAALAAPDGRIWVSGDFEQQAVLGFWSEGAWSRVGTGLEFPVGENSHSIRGLTLPADAPGSLPFLVGNGEDLSALAWIPDLLGRWLPRKPLGDEPVSGIGSAWGASASEIWGVGTSGVDNPLTVTGGRIWRYDGIEWAVHMNVPEWMVWTWGTAPDNVFAVGSEGAIYRYDGATWSREAVSSTSFLHEVHGTGPDDVWAVGSGGEVLHFDGISWRRVVLDGAGFLTGVVAAPDGTVVIVGRDGEAWVGTPEIVVEGDLVLESQADVDAAAGVTEVTGRVILRGEDIVDASPLTSIRDIEGDFWIERTGLRTLAGLQCLSRIGGELLLFVNDGLESIEALSSLEFLGGLRIVGSPQLGGDLTAFSNVTNTEFSSLSIVGLQSTSLESLEGLPPLERITGPLGVVGNFDLSPISSLEVVGDVLSIVNNDLLSDLSELGSLTSIGGTLVLAGLDNLTTLAGLSSLSSFDGLKVATLPRLGSLEGLPPMVHLSESLQIELGSPTDLSALSSLTSVGGTIEIQDTELTDLGFLSQLSTVGGALDIRRNELLPALDGLSSLQSVGGGIRIEANALQHLDGLSNLTTVQGAIQGFGLTISGNAELADCAGVRGLIEGGGVAEPVLVADNAPGCNSVEEILGNTLPGADVVVANPTDATTGEPSPVTVTFEEVTGAGETTVTSGSVGQGGGPPTPGGFRLGSPPTFYEVETTATFAGSVEVCIDYSSLRFGNESALRLMHFDDVGGWEDVTTSVDAVNDVVCGTTTSLSPFLVAEENAAPVVASLELPSDPVALGDAAAVGATFTDANPGDVHTATIDWGDGTQSAGTVVEPADGAPGSVTGEHVYTNAGVYTVTVTVTENVDPGFDLSGHRSSALETNAFLVVFDPSAGFVTGGGWIDSPPGAMPSDPIATGKASFGFVSRYARGAVTPTGRTQFHFKAGSLTFRSTSYDWLVVAGARAQFKGRGSVDGEGEFMFMLTAIDAAVPGGGDVDGFRIKIVDGTTGDVIYDNQIGADDTGSAVTALGGGQVVVHGGR